MVGTAELRIQEGEPGQWRRVIDTHADAPDDFLAPGHEAVVEAESTRWGRARWWSWSGKHIRGPASMLGSHGGLPRVSECRVQSARKHYRDSRRCHRDDPTLVELELEAQVPLRRELPT